MDRLIVEVASEKTRRSRIITGEDVTKYVELAKKMGIQIKENGDKVAKLSIRYYPGTFPEFDTDDDMDLLL